MRTLLAPALLLAILTASAVPVLAAGDTAYWYQQGRQETLLREEPQAGNVRAQQRAPRFRRVANGPVRELGDTLFVCIPENWDQARLDDLAHRYEMALLPGGSAAIRRFRSQGSRDALETANTLFENEGVSCAAPLWRKPVKTRALSDPLLAQQWHLNNTGQGGGLRGTDVGAFAAWQTTRGAGITVGVVDDGLELGHPDLAANLRAGSSRDFIRNSNDPTAGDHGTAVAGVVAAINGNGLGGSGVSPSTNLVGLRVLDEAGMEDEGAVVDAFGYELDGIHILNNSWGPEDDAYSAFELPSELARATMRQAVSAGRGGLGRIFVWAAGNGGSSDNSNLDGYANSRFVIAASASGNYGRAADYSEEGANILLNAPSSGGSLDIFSTDRSGALGYNTGYSYGEPQNADYTSSFGGTSAAAPMVAGAAALALAANPALNWRDVRQVLAASARHNDTSHPRWQRNAAGYWVSEQYGYGSVNAAKAVALASQWGPPAANEYSSQLYSKTVVRAIPDNSPLGISDDITVAEQMRVEFVEVTVDIEHSYWGDISLYLTSPAGTEIRLMTPRYLPQDTRTLGFHNWTLGDALHAGELASGRWRLRVVDDQSRDGGILRSWGLKIHGTALPARAEQLPLVCAGQRLDTGEYVPGALFYLGANRHGASFSESVSGTDAEDFGLVFGATSNGVVNGYLAIAAYRPPSGESVYLHYDNGGWYAWDGIFSPFSDTDIVSGKTQVLHMGRLAPGHYQTWVGYHSADGGIVYCPRSADFTVSPL
jgi:subtilisin family serine protease